MCLSRFRIRTLMIAVAIVAVILASLLRAPELFLVLAVVVLGWVIQCAIATLTMTWLMRSESRERARHPDAIRSAIAGVSPAHDRF